MCLRSFYKSPSSEKSTDEDQKSEELKPIGLRDISHVCVPRLDKHVPFANNEKGGTIVTRVNVAKGRGKREREKRKGEN